MQIEEKKDIFNWYLLFKYLLVVPGRESLLVPGGESPLGLFIFRKVFCKHKFLDNYFSNSISDNHHAQKKTFRNSAVNLMRNMGLSRILLYLTYSMQSLT